MSGYHGVIGFLILMFLFYCQGYRFSGCFLVDVVEIEGLGREGVRVSW